MRSCEQVAQRSIGKTGDKAKPAVKNCKKLITPTPHACVTLMSGTIVYHTGSTTTLPKILDIRSANYLDIRKSSCNQPKSLLEHQEECEESPGRLGKESRSGDLRICCMQISLAQCFRPRAISDSLHFTVYLAFARQEDIGKISSKKEHELLSLCAPASEGKKKVQESTPRVLLGMLTFALSCLWRKSLGITEVAVKGRAVVRRSRADATKDQESSGPAYTGAHHLKPPPWQPEERLICNTPVSVRNAVAGSEVEGVDPQGIRYKGEASGRALRIERRSMDHGLLNGMGLERREVSPQTLGELGFQEQKHPVTNNQDKTVVAPRDEML
ncbi:hypothetical protein U0070_003695 [Myodes glareolus]|uniref:Uncharacterized protein n=1 Tax=Myodes glareolus TaxID=447135 RepID=A0AAW0IHN0_MYOGA